MKKQIRRLFIPKYRMTSEEFSSEDLRRLAHNILDYEVHEIFYTKVLPISILVSILISILVLR